MAPKQRAGAAQANALGSTRYGIEAVSRAAELLRQFSRASPRHATSELARSTGLSLALVERTMLTLRRHGFARTQHDGSHQLGLRWLQLADVRRRQVDVRLLALPVMRAIRDAVNETVILSIRVGDRRVNIDYVESTQAIRRLTQLGFEVALHIGATGRALLSGLPPDELEQYLQSSSLAVLATDTSIPREKLLEEIDHVRCHGYAVAFREITSDTAAVSAPIHDHTGDVVAALTISCPEDRFTRALKQACIDHATKAADTLSQALGYKAVSPERPVASANLTHTQAKASAEASTQQPKVGGAGGDIVTAVERAAKVLLAFTQSWDFLTLPEVATRSGLSKATAFRILATLVAEGLVFQNADNGTYGLGALNFRLADVVLSGIEVRDSARLVMRQVRNQVNETVVLSVREGDDCYHVKSFESRQSIGHSQPIGVALPVHATAPGRAMLASMTDDAVDAYLKRLSPAAKRALSGASAARLRQEIKTIRRQGHAVSAGEASGGGHAIAVAVPSPQGPSVAALHISFPQGRFTNDLEQRCIDALKRAAGSIAKPE
jgi:DNA-binding IclR family transcriptional regulator